MISEKYNIDAGSQCYETFSSSLMTRPNKLKCLCLAEHFQSSVTITSKAGTREVLMKGKARYS